MEYNENWALEQAINIATYSTCQSQRGVILWDNELGLLACGYNRLPRPLMCDGSDACRENCAKTAIHAEQAALTNFIKNRSGLSLYDAEMLHVKIVDGKPVHSLQPSCWQCSKLILEAGIKYMWLYQKEGLVRYTGLEFHKETLKNCNL